MGKQQSDAHTVRSGRPSEFTRSDAVNAAMNLFWKKGYLAVSAKDLAAAMSIQRSSFYNSFGNREAVFLEALDVYARQAPDAPLADIRPGDPVIPVIVSVLRTLCRVRAADEEARGCLVCNSIAELVGVEEEIGILLEEAVEQRIALIERLLLQAAEQKEIPGDSGTGSAARSFIAFLLGLNVLSKVVRDEAQLWSACRHYLAGLGVRGNVLD